MQGLEQQNLKSGVQHVTVNGSVVVMTFNSHRQSPESIPQGSQIHTILLRQNWTVQLMGGDHEVMSR